jgi:hypothetical protein
MMRLTALALFLLFFSCESNNANADPLATAGIGVANCGKLATDMKPDEGLTNTANFLIFYWVQGYMSAANITTLESDSNYIDLSKFDDKTLLPMIYDYCSKNPDKKPRVNGRREPSPGRRSDPGRDDRLDRVALSLKAQAASFAFPCRPA